MSRLRRKKVCAHLNKSVQPLAKKDDLFKDAAPLLFGTEFAKKSKDEVDQMKAITAVLPSKKSSKLPSFQGGPSGNRGGYNNQMGRGGGHHKPQYRGRFNKFPRRFEQQGSQRPLQIEKSSLKCMLLNLGLTRVETKKGVAGRLKYHIKNNQGLVGLGHSIMWLQNRLHIHTHPHYNVEQDCLIVEEIRDLLEKGAVSLLSETEREGFYSNLFLVPKKDGGQRPVINLKALNQFIQPEHFKMEGIHTLKDMVKSKDWMAKIDKDAYFTIPIHTTQRKYLKFFVVSGQTYQFNCLPFSLSSAPWVFTKTLKPVAALLWEMGVRMIVYIDDILILVETKERAQEQEALVYLLDCLGFIVNMKKSVLSPAWTS